MEFGLKKVTDEDVIDGKVVIPKNVTSLEKSFFNARGEIVFEEDSQLEVIRSGAFATTLFQEELNLRNLKHLKTLEDKSLKVYTPHLKIVLPDTLEKIGFDVFSMWYDHTEEVSVSFKTSKIDLLFALNDMNMKRQFLDFCNISFYDYDEYAPKDTLFKPKMTLREFEEAVLETILTKKKLINEVEE